MKHATLYCVTPPSEAQLARMKAFLAREEGDPDVEITVEIELSLVSGFILRT